ncbi:MAG: kynureninase [Bacteroidota bacterium]
MTDTAYLSDLAFAQRMDAQDPLAHYRDQFYLPLQENGKPFLYFTGNSLGLQPKKARDYVLQEMDDWAKYGVEGHFHARKPWMPYHEFLTESMARVVGAKPIEVVVMNTLTVNLHLMMVSFYRPTNERYKILIEKGAFPSDQYAVKSQIAFHGFDPEEALLELPYEGDSAYTSTEEILSIIDRAGEEIALILLGGVNYYSGQAFELQKIAEAGHKRGCVVGFDLAHGAGNLPLQLHDSGADFAVWCTYKYLNSSPGSLAGCFVHERHAEAFDLPRFAGWWGHDKDSRFLMGPDFQPIPGAEGWQLSNPPILPMAAMRASLEIFDEAGMDNLVRKARHLTGYMEYLLDLFENDRIRIITPRHPAERGCQLSIQVKNADKSLFDQITQAGVIADWREPDVIRVAPVPLYNNYVDVFEFVEILKAAIND